MDSVLLSIILTNYIAISVTAVYGTPSCLNITIPKEKQQIKIFSLPNPHIQPTMFLVHKNKQPQYKGSNIPQISRPCI